MKCCVVGFGSIGKRHARILSDLKHDVYVVSSQKEIHFKTFPNLDAALKNENFEYIVVANPTALHIVTLLELKKHGYKGKVLVEKPLFSQNKKNDFSDMNICVAYNLRFHPLLQKLKEKIKDQVIISAYSYVGQFLPTWRPGRDYSDSYSANKEMGGGVLRDLSHELDFLLWLFGPVKKVASLGGRYSSLKINSEDSFTILAQSEKCPQMAIHLNYTDRLTQRFLILNTDENTFKLDFIESSLEDDNSKEKISIEPDDTYRSQHLSFINGDKGALCSYSEGVEVMNWIHIIEQAHFSNQWINLI